MLDCVELLSALGQIGHVDSGECSSCSGNGLSSACRQTLLCERQLLACACTCRRRGRGKHGTLFLGSALLLLSSSVERLASRTGGSGGNDRRRARRSCSACFGACSLKRRLLLFAACAKSGKSSSRGRSSTADRVVVVVVVVVIVICILVWHSSCRASDGGRSFQHGRASPTLHGALLLVLRSLLLGGGQRGLFLFKPATKLFFTRLFHGYKKTALAGSLSVSFFFENAPPNQPPLSKTQKKLHNKSNNKSFPQNKKTPLVYQSSSEHIRDGLDVDDLSLLCLDQLSRTRLNGLTLDSNRLLLELAGLSLNLLVGHNALQKVFAGVGLLDMLDAHRDALGQNAVTNGLVDNDAEGALGHVEDASGAAVVELVGHALVDGRVGSNVDQIAHLVVHQIGAGSRHAVLAKVASKQLARARSVSTGVRHFCPNKKEEKEKKKSCERKKKKKRKKKSSVKSKNKAFSRRSQLQTHPQPEEVVAKNIQKKTKEEKKKKKKKVWGW